MKMKGGTVACITLFVFLVALGAQLSAQSVPNPGANNPGIFQGYNAPVSSMLGFLASDAGKQVLLHSPSPAAQGVLARFFGQQVANQWPQQPLLKPRSKSRRKDDPTVTGCGTASGTEFNLEPATGAVPQNEPPVDFLVTRLGSGSGNRDLVVQDGNDFRFFVGALGSPTGVYVHRDPTVSCYGGTDFELGNPPIPNPLNTTEMVLGFGDARVVADAKNDQIIVADLRIAGDVTGVGLRRIPASNLTSTATCPAGTESPSAAAICVGSKAVIVSASDDESADFDSLAQDQRTSGTGAGDIYVTNTIFEFAGMEIHLTACKATFASLADCSPTITISGSDTSTQFSSVSVVPGGGPNAGKITITYVNFAFETIRFVVCTPHGAPAAPTCTAPTTIATEANPIISPLTDNSFRIAFIPAIANRADGTTGQTTFVVWNHCKVPEFLPLGGFDCPDTDVVMATSTNLATFSAATAVDATTGTHEFMPAISIDPAQNITNIAYYHTPDAFHYKNTTQVLLKQIPSGSTTPGAATPVTTSPDSPAGDANLGVFFPEYGDYIGVAARGSGGAGNSRAYIGHTNDSRLGIYNGAMNGDSNNHMSKVTY